VCDETNPRSVAYQALGLTDYLARLAAQFGALEPAALSDAVAELLSLRPEADLHTGSTRLDTLLERLGSAAYALSEQLGLRFFSHSGGVWTGTEERR